MTQPAAIHLQPRDLTLLTELGEVSLLDTDTIHRRHFAQDTSMRACRRRLRLYSAHGLTQALHIGIVRTDRPGRIPTVHRLTPEGAELVETETGVRPPRPARSDPPKPNTILHRLGVAKSQLALNDACKLHGLSKPDWILEYDTRPNLPINAKLTERYILCREFLFANGSVRRCWPDAACLLTVPHQAKQWRLAILWEYDRSTEGRVQLLEKVPGYESLLAATAWRHIFADADAVRIFFVVPSQQRLRVVAETFRNTALAGHLRIAVTADLSPDRALAAPIWMTPAGERRPLLAQGLLPGCEHEKKPRTP